jgi:hypothetical protein
MRTEQILLTPTGAEALLARNTANRKVRRSNVDMFVRKIKSGEWMLTHQGLAIAHDGTILDGQHRLIAIVETGATVPILVNYDCDKRIFPAIDSGVPRNNGDLTKLPARVIEMLNVISVMAGNMRSKLSPGEVFELNRIYGPACQSVNDFAPTSKKAVTAAPIRAAVAILVMEGCGDYARYLYRRTTLFDFEGMPKVTQIFVKHVLNSHNGGGSSVQATLFCKALKAFDPREKNALQCQYTDAIRDRAKERVLDLMKAGK